MSKTAECDFKVDIRWFVGMEAVSVSSHILPVVFGGRDFMKPLWMGGGEDHGKVGN